VSEAIGNPAESLPVDVRTRFERFPATVKGAFVMQGADGNPHVVFMESAAVARVPEGPERRIPMPSLRIDVAPRRDLFVPFEASLSDLEPGWYAIRSFLEVDGGRTYAFTSRPFCLPWPRSDVRRGTISLRATVRAGKGEFFLDRVELLSEHASVVWRPARPAAGDEDAGRGEGVEARLLAEGTPLEPLPPEAVTGRGALAVGDRRTLSYPAPRSTRSLHVVIRTAGGQESRPVEVPLD
jgi:hypothetical protein